MYLQFLLLLVKLMNISSCIMARKRRIGYSNCLLVLGQTFVLVFFFGDFCRVIFCGPYIVFYISVFSPLNVPLRVLIYLYKYTYTSCKNKRRHTLTPEFLKKKEVAREYKFVYSNLKLNFIFEFKIILASTVNTAWHPKTCTVRYVDCDP